MPKAVLENYQRLVEQAKKVRADEGNDIKICIQVGSATCENAAGSVEVYEELRKNISASGRSDILLRRVGCTGRCSCEPIVGVIAPNKMPVKYEKVDRALAHKIFVEHVQGGHYLQEHILDDSEAATHSYQFLFCESIRCQRSSGKSFQEYFTEKLSEIINKGFDSAKVEVLGVHCLGMCNAREAGKQAHILVRPGNIIYRVSEESHIDQIIKDHVQKDRIVEKLSLKNQALEQRFFDLYGDVLFFSKQSRLALRNSGIIDPENIFEYIHFNGFAPLAQAMHKGNRKWIIEELIASKLRGRGGGGFPTGQKWAMAADKEGEKYIICNADEGDPGAFMDRSMLEGDPFSIIEGMIIGAYAMNASHGFLYIRAEYPMAIRRIENAISECHKHGLLGNNILGSGFNFDLEIRLGAGAFVCGEETALIHSIEGERGQPRIRPPYPTDEGLWQKPTVINNVETWANVPVVLLYGADWFSQMGTEKSGGTKVFALAGKVQHTGLVEVPMGTTLKEIVFNIGGGVPKGKKLKAIQTGGPAGGCLPLEWIDTPVDFDTLTKAGSIMGSGGMIIMDEDDCMVDIAKFFMTFSQDESCGKCTPCREGTKRMLEILEKITSGKAEMQDLVNLERLANLVKKSSLCGLGRAAPNPVLSTLRHYRSEYEAHVKEKRCPARRCTALLRYEVIPDKCVGCTACARNCPVYCILGKTKQVHEIDQQRCIKCGRCFEVCRFQAISRG